MFVEGKLIAEAVPLIAREVNTNATAIGLKGIFERAQQQVCRASLRVAAVSYDEQGAAERARKTSMDRKELKMRLMLSREMALKAFDDHVRLLADSGVEALDLCNCDDVTSAGLIDVLTRLPGDVEPPQWILPMRLPDRRAVLAERARIQPEPARQLDAAAERVPNYGHAHKDVAIDDGPTRGFSIHMGHKARKVARLRPSIRSASSTAIGVRIASARRRCGIAS